MGERPKPVQLSLDSAEEKESDGTKKPSQAPTFETPKCRKRSSEPAEKIASETTNIQPRAAAAIEKTKKSSSSKKSSKRKWRYPKKVMKFTFEKCLTSEDLAAYFKSVHSRMTCKLGIPKAKFEKALKHLHYRFIKTKVEKQVTWENYKVIELAMEKTFKWRFYEMFTLKRMTIRQIINFYPGLRIFQWLPEEYDLVFPDKCNNTDFLDSVKTLLINFAIESTASIETFQSLQAQNLLRSLKSHIARKRLRENKLSAFAYAFAMEMTKEKAKGTLFEVLDQQTEKRKSVHRLTPFIDIAKIEGKEIWDNDYPMIVYVEASRVLQAKNFFEALVACYIYYWIFNLEYKDQDKMLFRKFDTMFNSE